eukprot:scaffold87408_cov14-Tisochrysis_lutea.AAC.1
MDHQITYMHSMVNHLYSLQAHVPRPPLPSPQKPQRTVAHARPALAPIQRTHQGSSRTRVQHQLIPRQKIDVPDLSLHTLPVTAYPYHCSVKAPTKAGSTYGDTNEAGVTLHGALQKIEEGKGMLAMCACAFSDTWPKPVKRSLRMAPPFNVKE